MSVATLPHLSADLGAILLGEPPYERSSAPEPEQVAALAALLPAEVLEHTAFVLTWAGFVEDHERLPALGILLGRTLESGLQLPYASIFSHRPQVIAYLPEAVLPQALEAILAEDERYLYGGDLVLAELARRFTEELFQALLRAIKGSANDPFPDFWTPALANLAANPGDQLAPAALAGLLPWAHRIQSRSERGVTLARLSRFVPPAEREDLLYEALTAARGMDHTLGRLQVILEVARHAEESRRAEVLSEAGQLARTLPNTDERARGLVEVAMLSDAPSLLQELHSLQVGFYSNEISIGAAAGLAAYLSPEQLAVLAARLPSSGLGEIQPLRQAVTSFSPAHLETLIERLDPQSYYMDLETQARFLIELAPHLPETLVPAALEIAGSLPEHYWRVRTQVAYLRHLPSGQRSAIDKEAERLSPEGIRRQWPSLSYNEQVRLGEEMVSQFEVRRMGAQMGAAEPLPIGEDSLGRGPAEEEIPPFVEEEQRVVNTGFSSSEAPGEPIPADTPLLRGRTYYFWFEVGVRVAGAIDVAPVPVPPDLPAGTRLFVVLFAFPSELSVEPGQDVGEIELLSDHSARVVRPAALPDGLPDGDLAERRLFFPVHTPARSGDYRLRCNLYHQGVLIQSRVVQAQVISRQRSRHRYQRALRTDLDPDYALSNTLSSDQLENLRPHVLSVLLNDNGDGTTGFRFFHAGEQGIANPGASFTGQELQDMIRQGRQALRQAAWGDKETWSETKAYLYEQGSQPEQLKRDLIRLARWGYRFYRTTIERLAAGNVKYREQVRQAVERMQEGMRRPGFIQFASKESASHVFPAALVYDYDLRDGLPTEMYALCPAFLDDLNHGRPLMEAGCFMGDCPSRADKMVICPSGFWGFRHAIGLPVSIGGSLDDATLAVRYRQAPTFSMAVSTDPRFTQRPSHERALRSLFTGMAWNYADTGQGTTEMLRTSNPNIVYFYCHGGVFEEDNLPYLRVGSLDDAWGLLLPTVLAAEKILWNEAHPLVFINGCYTTALEPEVAMNFVEAFVRTAQAAGVIGTEITIFEPLATAFSSAFLKEFLSGVPAGEALRLARLCLLQEGNPLGLVYIPFVIASLALKAED